MCVPRLPPENRLALTEWLDHLAEGSWYNAWMDQFDPWKSVEEREMIGPYSNDTSLIQFLEINTLPRQRIRPLMPNF